MSLFGLLDLELPWKPLHDLLENVLYNKFESHGLVLIPKNLENILKNAVRTCRPYFLVSATRQMLDEFRPLLCPFDVSITVMLSFVVVIRCCHLLLSFVVEICCCHSLLTVVFLAVVVDLVAVVMVVVIASYNE